MAKKLWLAMVGHESVPGTKLKLLYQEAEPEDREIIPHFADETDDLQNLCVIGVFDVSWELRHRGNKEPFCAAARQIMNG